MYTVSGVGITKIEELFETLDTMNGRNGKSFYERKCAFMDVSELKNLSS